MPEFFPMFAAMTVIYVVAFFGVAAEWFWGRWFATGLGYWGTTMVIWAWVATRQLPTPLVIFGAMHAIISVCLAGEKMAAAFDAKPQWRERWKLDEQGVIRVRKSVTRAASSLPALIMFALAPREGQELLLAWAAVAFGVFGLSGILSGRSVGVLALMAGSVATAMLLLVGHAPLNVELFFQREFLFGGGSSELLLLSGGGAAVLLGAAALPFVRPMAAYLFARR